ncbi:hypothetical protein [Bradyrhizobium oligotrophicum]|uniref:hypothetical protein n=1 Tax=Bradyrhizobium oligotrophicum TaxID=44255 RepID=UPI00034D2C87|nr:hypothetical protein [Bradyrhizobium oligotrophicum]
MDQQVLSDTVSIERDHGRHCERSEAIQTFGAIPAVRMALDRFAALAMTENVA